MILDSIYFLDQSDNNLQGIHVGFYDREEYRIVLPIARLDTLGNVDFTSLYIDETEFKSDTIHVYSKPSFSVANQGRLLKSGGYVYIGYEEFASEDIDFRLLKTDKNGELIWEKFYGTSTIDLGKCICESYDGSLYIGGGSLGYGSHVGNEYENLLIKTDKDGNELWRKHWGEDGSESIVTLNCTDDGGVIAVGGLSPWFEDKNSHYSQPYIAKLDKDGTIEWEFTEPPPDYGYGSGADNFVVARITDEGNIFVLGTGPFRDSVRYQSYMPWLYALDQEGNLLMKRSYESVIDTPNTAIAFDLIQTSDGGFLLGGTYFDENATTQGNHQDAFILKLDERGCEYEDCQPPLSVGEEPKPETDEFTAWPNPFSNEIEFTTLGRPGTLTVYDMRGVMIKEMNVAEKTPSVRLNAETLASGVYIASFRDSGTGQRHVLRIVKH